MKGATLQKALQATDFSTRFATQILNKNDPAKNRRASSTRGGRRERKGDISGGDSKFFVQSADEDGPRSSGSNIRSRGRGGRHGAPSVRGRRGSEPPDVSTAIPAPSDEPAGGGAAPCSTIQKKRGRPRGPAKCVSISRESTHESLRGDDDVEILSDSPKRPACEEGGTGAGRQVKRGRQHGIDGLAMMPSYLRSRFGDRYQLSQPIFASRSRWLLLLLKADVLRDRSQGVVAD